jgi:hypothetical protein
MNVNVEELLREGLDRLTADARIPAGLTGKARAHRRRRQVALRAALVGGTAAVTAAAGVTAVVATGGAGAGAEQARTTAYVVKNVEKALANENLVMRAQSDGTFTFHGKSSSEDSPTTTWVYGSRLQMEEFSGLHSPAQPYWDQGTALIGGKLASVYVTYFDHRWSMSVPPPGYRVPTSACLTTGALGMGGPPAIPDWPAFIRASLACGAATVTGHARIDGVQTTVITGLSAKVKMVAGQAKSVGEKWAQVPWTLYVNPTTYLPVRLVASTVTSGGPQPTSVSTEVSNIQWLPPTTANLAHTLVTIPAGFKQVKSVADQQ